LVFRSPTLLKAGDASLNECKPLIQHSEWMGTDLQ
jgi:hypothetical protein